MANSRTRPPASTECKTKGMGISVKKIAPTNVAVRQRRRAKYRNQRTAAKLQSNAARQASRTIRETIWPWVKSNDSGTSVRNRLTPNNQVRRRNPQRTLSCRRPCPSRPGRCHPRAHKRVRGDLIRHRNIAAQVESKSADIASIAFVEVL